MRTMYALPCLALACLSAATRLPAQTPPAAYTITETMMGDDKSTLTITRSGMKVLMEAVHPASAGTPASHSFTFYDLTTHVSHTWEPSVAPPVCSVGTFSGDWGDPFSPMQEITDAIAKGDIKPSGDVTMYGIPTRLYSGVVQGSKVNVWLDLKDNLIIRVTAQSPGTPIMTMVNIVKISITPPPAALVAMPAYCAAIKPPPTAAETIATETGDDAANYVNAIYGPGSKNSCSIVVRVVESRTMAPVTRKWQAAIDTTYDVDHPPAYTFGVGDDGTSTFAGGGLHEVTSQIHNDMLRIDNPPAYFNLALNVIQPNHGSATALIYRQCSAPVSMLYYVLKDPTDPGQGGDYLYAKSGKYAAIPAH